jgi:hypothetical protein
MFENYLRKQNPGFNPIASWADSYGEHADKVLAMLEWPDWGDIPQRYRAHVVNAFLHFRGTAMKHIIDQDDIDGRIKEVRGYEARYPRPRIWNILRTYDVVSMIATQGPDATLQIAKTITDKQMRQATAMMLVDHNHYEQAVRLLAQEPPQA